MTFEFDQNLLNLCTVNSYPLLQDSLSLSLWCSCVFRYCWIGLDRCPPTQVQILPCWGVVRLLYRTDPCVSFDIASLYPIIIKHKSSLVSYHVRLSPAHHRQLAPYNSDQATTSPCLRGTFASLDISTAAWYPGPGLCQNLWRCQGLELESRHHFGTLIKASQFPTEVPKHCLEPLRLFLRPESCSVRPVALNLIVSGHSLSLVQRRDLAFKAIFCFHHDSLNW